MSPAQELREILSIAKDIGLSFDQGWEWAWENMRRPEGMDRLEWKQWCLAMRWAQDEWHRCYEDKPIPKKGTALGSLHLVEEAVA